MQKHMCLLLMLLIPVVLYLLVYLFDIDHTTSDITKEDGGLENVDLLKKQLRTAEKQIQSMRRIIDSGQQKPDCEIIHIAVVCTGHATIRDVVILIKSILLNRQRPLHFHFISDRTAHHILKYMFKTWEIPSVTVSFYSTGRVQNQTLLFEEDIADVDNFYKLALPMVLSKEIDKVILLDPNTIVNVDIAELWMLFRTFVNKEAIGAVENQNSWYPETLKKDKRNRQILGKGINTGMILYDLKRLRKIAFIDKAIRVKQMGTLGTKFSYEDIFNAVLMKNAAILHYLPEKWIVQLSKKPNVDYCNSSAISEIKIVQGYLYDIFAFKSRCMVVFRKLHNSYLELSGNLLKRYVPACKSSLLSIQKSNSLSNKSADCIDFRIQEDTIFRTHLYFIEYDYKTKPNDVTMVTQMTMERLTMFDQICKHWDGPISIALHLTEIEAYEFLRFVKGSNLKTRKNIGYHVVYKEGTNGLYPYNYLRNVALENVNTPFVFLSDVDFLPVIGMYQNLQSNILNQGDMKMKKALVIPAFEQTEFKLNFPNNKQELLIQLERRQIIPIRFDIFSRGQWATDYPKWILAKDPYKVNYGKFYEPYMVLPKDIPKYDKRFVGWGWDKISHTIELDADGYEFMVSPDLFIIHIPHAKTYHRIMYFADSKYISCVKNLKIEFLSYVAEKYGQRGQKYRQLYKELFKN